ncbi:MAG TPA: PDZ domain-containing protein, partial [Burkholderiaceae bacterium]|nr:PDZ domain-containing protein [Burkholderiaceae bacterium]
TSYYDDLFLLRTGLVDATRYLKLVARAAHAVRQAPGQAVQSVAEASFDAWIRYYRPDENTPNATISYYAKGSLVALRLDLALRTQGKATLDDVMRALWTRSPKAVADDPRDASNRAVTEDAILATVARLGGKSLAADLALWVHERHPLDVLAPLAKFGVEVDSEPSSLATELGLVVSESALAGVHVKSVLAGGAGAAAGLSAGDEILAIDGWRVRRLDDAQGWTRMGDALEVLVARRQRVATLRVPPRDALARAAARAPVFRLAPAPTAAVRARRIAWLGA